MNDRVVDITHSLGATIVGMIAIFIVWIFLHFKLSLDLCCYYYLHTVDYYNPIPFLFCILSLKEIIIIVSWLFLILLFGYSRYHTLIAQQELVNTKFVEKLNDLSRYPKSPIEILYVKSN